MGSNSFGNLFRITTWGESHGNAIGVVIDGCPAGLDLTEADINEELALRAPGRNPFTSSRREPDHAEILSGVFQGKTTGAPLSLSLKNQDAHSASYDDIKELLRPGHANYTYLKKYGLFDYRGGGRSSARETACRVAAGAVAKKWLQTQGIQVLAYLCQVGPITTDIEESPTPELRQKVRTSALFCPNADREKEMRATLQAIQAEGDSIGGAVAFAIYPIPVGLGDPVYEKLGANLAKAMLTIPAAKGFELGKGFEAASQRGSEYNDLFEVVEGETRLRSNHAGGTLGGISTGLPLLGRVAFKPTSSIRRPQPTVDLQGREQTLQLPEGSRHDPCVAVRGVPVVEAMAALTLVDALLLHRCARL